MRNLNYLHLSLSTLLLLICIYANTCICIAQETISDKQEFSISSTSIIKNNKGEEKQLICIKNKLETSDYELTIQYPDNKTIAFKINEEGVAFREIPVLEKQTEILATFSIKGKGSFTGEFILYPPKRWTIYDIQVSHHDLGYADYYHMMRRDIREMGIEMALDFCRQTDNNPYESQFRWTVETSEPLIPFLQNKPDSLVQELARRIREGRIALGGIHNSASTEHLSYENYARLFYTPNRFVADWLDIPKSKTALNDDIVGFTRSMPLYAKEADIENFFLGRNSAVNAFENLQEEPAFYWNSQDLDKQKTLFKVFEYYSPDRLVKYNAGEIATFLDKYESYDNWPYNCLMAEDSYDFSVPELSNIEGIKKWNEQYSNPKIVSGTFDMFFDHLKGQEELRPFVEFDKDVPNSWSDEDYGDAQYAGKVHHLGYFLPEAEKFASIAQAYSPGRYPWEEAYQAYNRLLQYAEHTNGAYAEGPIYVPESLKDSSAANACYYEVEQRMHRALVEEAEMFTNTVVDHAFTSLKKSIGSSSEHTLIVFNSLNFSRDDYVTFSSLESLSKLKIIDNVSGEEVDYQILPNDSILFIAKNVPSVGYKTYSLLSSGRNAGNDSNLSDDNSIENEFYKITFDPLKGAICSIYDKTLQRELVDHKAEYGFNDYIYQRYENRKFDDGITEYRTDSATINCFKGELVSIMKSEVHAFGCESVIQTVKLYKGVKRIDFELDLEKSHSERSLHLYREGSAQNKEALFYAFPFDIPDFTIRHELPGGSVEPILDQSAGSSTDYYAIQHYCDISNNDFGITLTLTDPNLIEYGKPRVAPWNKGDGFESILEKPKDPHVFLYLANNLFFTNMRQSQHNEINFRWSLSSHSGNWHEGKAYKTGWINTHDLLPVLSEGINNGVLPESHYSFLKVDAENVICSAIKPAEANGEGYILRFFELAGKPTKVKAQLALGFPIEKVVETNLIEDDRDVDISVTGTNDFEFEMPPFGIKTLRVVPKYKGIPEIQITKIEALSDREVKLRWETGHQNADNIAYYKIYRSESPDLHPSSRYYIGSTENQEYIDKPTLNYGGWISSDIKPSTTYYYNVLPIGKDNSWGKESNMAQVTTKNSSQNDFPPSKVQGLYATHVSDISPYNYNAIFFYTNIEDDVVGYNIYRNKQKGFIPTEADLIGEIDANKSFEHVTPHGFAKVTRSLKEFNRQLFIDQNVKDLSTYYYRVCAIDEAGNKGDFSDDIVATAEAMNLDIRGTRTFSDEAQVEIFPSVNHKREIRYTLDESEPMAESYKYSSPFKVSETTTIKAAIFENGERLPYPISEKTFYKSNDYKVSYNTPYSKRWSSTGDLALVDNAQGEYYTDGFWLGFQYDDIDLVIDLKEIQKVSGIKSTFLSFTPAWIFLPQSVEFTVSIDGETWVPAGKIVTDPKMIHREDFIEEYAVECPIEEIRFIKVIARNQQYCPPWHSSAGGRAWLFIDEVQIENGN